MPLTLTSDAFSHGGNIPRRYTCDGEDVSPRLTWTDPPGGTASFALVCDDPDAPAGTWTHWVIYNIPAEVRALAEATPPNPELSGGARQGKNSWGRIGYGGPCPPSGTHRYFFRFFALDRAVDLPSGASARELSKAIHGHVLAQAELMGRYSRKR